MGMRFESDAETVPIFEGFLDLVEGFLEDSTACEESLDEQFAPEQN